MFATQLVNSPFSAILHLLQRPSMGVVYSSFARYYHIFCTSLVIDIKKTFGASLLSEGQTKTRRSVPLSLALTLGVEIPTVRGDVTAASQYNLAARSPSHIFGMIVIYKCT